MAEKATKNNRFMGVFDVIFIMILCFATLLTTMLMQGGVLVGGSTANIHYTFKIGTFLVCAIGFLIYLAYILPQSNNQLKLIVHEMYKSAPENKPLAKKPSGVDIRKIS